jgi:hypothetical protein
MEIVPPIAEKWTFCIRFAFQKAGSVPDFDFLCNAALTAKRFGPLPIIPRFGSGSRSSPEPWFFSMMKK